MYTIYTGADADVLRIDELAKVWVEIENLKAVSISTLPPI